MKEFHRRDFANRTGLAQAWTVKSADRLFTHKLTTLLAERVDFLAELACSRHGYMDQVKTRTTAKADKKGLKRRAGDPLVRLTSSCR